MTDAAPEEAPVEEAPAEEVPVEEDTIGQRIDAAVAVVKDELNAKIDGLQAKFEELSAKVDSAQGQ